MCISCPLRSLAATAAAAAHVVDALAVAIPRDEGIRVALLLRLRWSGLLKLSTWVDNNTVGFQGKLATLVSMYLCRIVVDGNDHKSAKYVIQTKVMLVNLMELAQKIRDTPRPYITKKNLEGLSKSLYGTTC